MTKSRAMLGLGLCGSALFVCSSAFADVFINEFHYDNASTDTNEKIEVIAPAGTSMTGWKVVLYNGNGGVQYGTYSFSGTTANQCGGHGTSVVTIPSTPGLQNGAPDGFALVNPSNQVVQFLSYEGTFAATDGPAAGMTSTAIPQSESDATPAGQSLRLTGTGSSYSQFSWAAAATSSFGACNAGQTLTTGGGSGNQMVNNVPISNLAATTGNANHFFISVPSGASNLVITTTGGSGDADLYVRFGSAPTLSTYNCRSWATGNVESCSFPTPSAGNYHVMVHAYTSYSGVTLKGVFNTGATDTAPTLLTTNPANGASNVAVNANITVPFSEAVTLSPGWFTLSCSATGNHTAVVSAGPVNWSLNPDVDFGPLETCTLTVIAANVRDQDGTIQTMASNASVSFTTTGAQTGYYAGVNTTSASALRASLHPIIDDSLKIPYTASTTDTWDVLNVADQDPLNSGRILDIYKNTPYTKSPGGNNFYNREHTWPNSLGFPSDGPSNYPYTDVHMLMASDIAYNSTRSNKPYGNCPSGCTEYPTLAYNGRGGGSGTYPGNSNWSNARVFVVWNGLKGNMARAMFYMDLRYEGGTHGGTGAAEPDLRLTDTASLITQSGSNASVAYMGFLSTLLQWHQQDPVDNAERLRNEVIQTYQGNRNPFIDHPEWVACIYQSVCN
jgi:endonuclease I